MDPPLISIIIPAFNVQEYIGTTLQSALNQSYDNVEVVVVNDGSSDSTLNICKRMLEGKPRTKLIDKENGGLGSARNAGLEESEGDYIFFLDGDDLIDKFTIEYLMDALLAHDASLAICRYKKITAATKYSARKRSFVTISREAAVEEALCAGSITVSACGKLFEKKLWDTIRFPVGTYYEDMSVIPLIMAKASRILCTDSELYGYVTRPGSITGKRHINEKQYRDALNELENVQSDPTLRACVNNETLVVYEAVVRMRLARYLPDEAWAKQEKQVATVFIKEHRSTIYSNTVLNRLYKFRFALYALSPKIHDLCFYAYGKVSRKSVV